MVKRQKVDSRPTMAQIASAAGVSVPTVSKVLNGRLDVSSTTRDHIQQIIEQYGFVHNRNSRTAQKRKTGLVDLVIPRLDDDYFIPILQGAEHIFREMGVRLVVSTTHYNSDQELQWIETLTERATDGILLVLPSDEAIQRLTQQGTPFVIIHNQSANVPSVTITSWDSGFAATNYLIGLGHKRIAYIGKNAQSMEAIKRIASYRTALEVASIPLDPALQQEGEFSTEDGYTATMALMALASPPTAIFAGNDHHAIGVYHALYELGIAIPQQVSVIGFDNLPYTQAMNPPLTTVHVPRLEMGQVAANMLLKLIAGETLSPNQVVLPTQLIERQSCAPFVEQPD